jgi:hypothetical protein
VSPARLARSLVNRLGRRTRNPDLRELRAHVRDAGLLDLDEWTEGWLQEQSAQTRPRLPPRKRGLTWD